MATEAYRVGVALALQGNTLGAVEAIAREMRGLDKLVKNTEESFANLGRSFSESARSAISVAEQLGRVMRDSAESAARAGGGSAPAFGERWPETLTTPTGEAIPHVGKRMLADYPNARAEEANRQKINEAKYADADRLNRDRDAAYLNDRRLAEHENADRDAAARRRHVHEGDLLALGLGGIYAGDQAVGLLDRSFTAYAAIGAEQAKLAMAGFTPKQQAAAAEAARQAAQTIPVGQAAGLEMIRDTYAVLQNAGEATKVLPDLARMSVVLGAVGKGDQVKELFAAQQAGELRGAFSKPGSKEIDFARFADFLGKMSNVVVETGGRISPADFVKFLKQAGTAGALMSDRALFQEFPAILLSMGSSRAGTATSSFYQTEFGRLYAPYGREQERIGLIAPGGYVKTKGSGGGSVKEGALHGEQLAKTDLYMWAHDFLLPTMRQSGYTDVQSQLVELYRLFPRSTITREFEELIRNQALIDKHIAGFGNVQANAGKNGGLYAEAVRNNPEIQLQQFRVAENNFLIAAGKNLAGPAMMALNAGTKALNLLGAWATSYPTTAKVIEATAISLGVLSGAIGTLALALLPLMAAGRFTKASLALLRGGAAAGAGEAGVDAGTGVAAVGGAGAAAPVLAVGGGLAYFLYKWGQHFRQTHPEFVKGVMDWEHRHPRGLFGIGPAVNSADATVSRKPVGKGSDSGSLTADEIGKAMRANLDGMKVTLDGQTVGQLVAKHQAKAANRPPTTPSQPDVRLTPLYPTSGYQ